MKPILLHWIEEPDFEEQKIQDNYLNLNSKWTTNMFFSIVFGTHLNNNLLLVYQNSKIMSGSLNPEMHILHKVKIG